MFIPEKQCLAKNAWKTLAASAIWKHTSKVFMAMISLIVTCVTSDQKIRIKQKSTTRKNILVSNTHVTNVTTKVKFWRNWKGIKMRRNTRGWHINAICANTELPAKGISKSMCKQCTMVWHTNVMSAISVLARQEQWDGTRRQNICKHPSSRSSCFDEMKFSVSAFFFKFELKNQAPIKYQAPINKLHHFLTN